ncbi:hypothetical protein AB0912_26125 [Streptomyces sp. NPDC007084]|uniref:hypothetical protein n=1 Tax=Streptomyces sp. NPDC007084 TaxID=3154313 RepID=UPI00345214DB
MRTLVEAATGLPGILFTAALVVALSFWLLAALGLVAVDAFDTDVDLGAWNMGGVPVTVALSLLTVFAWLLDLGFTLLLTAVAAADLPAGLPPLAAAAGSLLVAWRLTCMFVRPLHRLFPDEPSAAEPAEPVEPVRRTERAGTAERTARTEPSERVGHRRAGEPFAAPDRAA